MAVRFQRESVGRIAADKYAAATTLSIQYNPFPMAVLANHYA
jgi:hypothetical protein